MPAARDLPGGIASNSGRCRGCGLDCYCQAVGGEGGGSRSRGSCQATCRSCNSCACVPIILPSSGMRCSTPRLQGSVACLKNSLPWNEIPYPSPLQRPPGQTYFPSFSYDVASCVVPRNGDLSTTAASARRFAAAAPRPRPGAYANCKRRGSVRTIAAASSFV